MKRGRHIFYMLSLMLIFLLNGCKEMVEVPSPTTSLTSGNVYSNDATAAAVLTGIYATMSANIPTNNAQGILSISLACGLSADELTLYGGAANGSTRLAEFYLNRLTSGVTTSEGFVMWPDFYSRLYIVNLALERLSASSNTLSSIVKQQLIGEAKFIRAFSYFYLLNLYGDVPLATSSNYTVNATLTRSPEDKVYEQIISDLKEAQVLLSSNYVSADAKSITKERVRPNKWAATALLARVYLYKGEWANAEMEATAVINNSSAYTLDNLDATFLKNSNEAIWQLQPVNAGWNTEDARFFVLPATGPTSSSSYPVYLSSQLIGSFEKNDNRKLKWVDSVIVNGSVYYYPYKYKSATLNAPVTEYAMMLRLGEQYLIRAEARAYQNDISGAKNDLNIIRLRAGLVSAITNDKINLLSVILHERQIELFTEWGHRWLDLKRTGNVEAAMNLAAVAKGTSWNSNWQWYPVPAYEIAQNPNLTQNSDY